MTLQTPLARDLLERRPELLQVLDALAVAAEGLARWS